MQAKKSLGQNFLRDKKILKKIVDFAQIEKEDTVVEVGAGEGIMTGLILDKAKKVIAIEKDENLAELLEEKFRKEIGEEKLKVICADVLKLQPQKCLARLDGASTRNFSAEKYPCIFGAAAENRYKLVGNIPYYITGALFKKFLETENQPKSITFVVQKEVADRIMASDSKESILSISIKAYGEPKFGGVIKAGSFYPKPKVDSAIVSVRNINKERFSDLQENKFFEILKKGFSHKRKLLIKNLNADKEIFKKCEIPEKARAENLKVDDWICLSKFL